MPEPTQSLTDALASLRAVADPDELRTHAEASLSPDPRPGVNAHIHLPPNFSAFQSVGEAIDLAGKQGVRVLGASNYYDFSVYADFIRLAREKGIFPLLGLEVIALLDDLVRDGVKINDPGNPGKMYLCGKGITKIAPMSPRAAELMDTVRSNDTARMTEMIEKLVAHFAAHGVAIDMNHEVVLAGLSAHHRTAAGEAIPVETITLQERHVAQAAQRALAEEVPPGKLPETLASLLGTQPASRPGDAVGMQGEIRSHLMKAGKPCFVPESFISFEQARELILQLGGIPCYPTLADGTDPICPFEQTPETLVGHLQERNIHAAELIPTRNTPEVLEQYATALREAGIVVVGGTEHNTQSLGPIEPACKGGVPLPDEVAEIFWEGACVVAGHQMLQLHGLAGYVDAQGNPAGAYPSAESRISDLAAIGSAAIELYFQTTGDRP